ncbi:MAG: hypothetical protein HY814_03875 [Candidatus Riflebacteria bacterium]|nr:hypothetical protein [Candidatus Riflebacteria bacterium]
MRALPRLPLAFREGLSWTDVLPLGVLPAGPRRMAAQFLRAFFPGLGCVRASQRFVSPSIIETVVESRWMRFHQTAPVHLDPVAGLGMLQTDGMELRRIRRE